MQKYKYRAVDVNKKHYSGVYLAENEQDLKNNLVDMGLFLISCRVIKAKKINSFFTLSGKISLKELASFCNEFSLLLDSTLEVINCLELLKEQQKNSYFKQILNAVYEDVKSGLSLYESFNKHKKAFPNFFLSMVYVGEMSSSLNAVFHNLSEYIDKEVALKSKAKNALIYPTVILILMLGVVIVMMAFVIPTFKTSMSRLDVELPQITKVIYDMSEFFSANWLYVIIAIAGAVVLFKLISITKYGRYVFDSFKIYAPFFKGITRNLASARLARGLGLLLKSGMKLVDAMNVAKKLISNTYVEKKFIQAIEKVQSGATLFNALSEMKIFSPVFLQMVGVAERSATLDDGMFRIAKYFDEQANYTLNNLTSMLQPALLLLTGAVVAIIFLAVYSPMTTLMNKL